MYETILRDAIFNRLMEHFKDSKSLSFLEFLYMLKEENYRILVNDQKCIYGELEIEPADFVPV